MIRKYESNKAKQYLKYLVILIPVVQIFSLSFFTLVGKFEKVDTDTILQSVRGIVTLSSTVTLSIITIYVIYILNKNLISRYIGTFRERTYIYPSGRNEMFTGKLKSVLCVYAILFIITLSIVNVIYIFFSNNVLLLNHTLHYFTDLLSILSIVNLSLIVSVTVILYSLIFGIKFQSTNISLITGIILIVIIGNVVANSYRLSNFNIFIINIFICLVDYTVFRYLSYLIIKDDVMS